MKIIKVATAVLLLSALSFAGLTKFTARHAYHGAKKAAHASYKVAKAAKKVAY